MYDLVNVCFIMTQNSLMTGARLGFRMMWRSRLLIEYVTNSMSAKEARMMRPDLDVRKIRAIWCTDSKEPQPLLLLASLSVERKRWKLNWFGLVLKKNPVSPPGRGNGSMVKTIFSFCYYHCYLFANYLLYLILFISLIPDSFFK